MLCLPQYLPLRAALDFLVIEMEEQPKAISVEKEEKEEESRDEMLSRHRKEISELQNKEIALKKAAAKGSKAEQKAKKKQVEEEVSQLSSTLKEKQAQELASLGYNSKAGNNIKDKDNLDNLVNAIAGVSVTSQSKPSKSLKRREKRAQEEAAREQRIQQEQTDIVSDRMVENEKLQKKLQPLGLSVHEVKPDGHCLFRAVENQLGNSHTFLELRQMVSGYMRNNSSDFLPFFHSESGGGDSDDDGSLQERFENYCREVESTAAWGGQLELEALTHVLKRHVMIYSGSIPDVEMGKEYKSQDGSSIILSYHKHAFGLGEHYNSVIRG